MKTDLFGLRDVAPNITIEIPIEKSPPIKITFLPIEVSAFPTNGENMMTATE